MPTTARELLADAAATLAVAGVPTPATDAELLLAHVTGRSRAGIRLGGEITAQQVATFQELVARRRARIPLQHLTGTAPFRHLELAVGPGVFVPRPETELLVDEVLEFVRSAAPHAEGWVVVDLCSGSGALALSLATELGTWWQGACRTSAGHHAPSTRVVAVEVSPDALGWAARNLDAHAQALDAAASEVELLAADATTVAEPSGPLAELRGLVDVVVTNPPYIPDDAVPRDPEVRDHDPALALYGGPDGLDVVRRLARQAAALLRPGGLFVVEHADEQGEDAGDLGVPALLRAEPGGWNGVVDHSDLTGRPRYTTAVRAAPAITASIRDPAAAARARQGGRIDEGHVDRRDGRPGTPPTKGGVP